MNPGNLRQQLLNEDEFAIDLLVDMRRNVIIANVILYLALFGLLAILVGPWVSFGAVAFLGLDPMQIGFTRLLHMDGMSTICLMCAIVGWSAWLVHKSKGALVISAIIGGVGIATRSVDVVVIGILATIVVVDALLVQRGSIGRAIRQSCSRIIPLVIWTLLSLLTIFAIWPALWVAPVGTLRRLRSDTEALALVNHAASMLYRGESIRRDPGWLFYPIMLAIRTNPLTVLGLILALSMLIIPSSNGNPLNKRLVVHLTTFAITYMVLLGLADKKLDRYALPILASMNLIAMLGAIAFICWASRFLTRINPVLTRSIPLAVVAIMLLGQSGIAARQAPYYENYVSPLVGGSANIETRFSIANGEALRPIAEALKSHPEISVDDVGVLIWNRALEFYLLGPVFEIGRGNNAQGLISLFANDYVIVTPTELNRGLYAPQIANWFGTLTPFVAVTDMGKTVAHIYDLSNVHIPYELVLGTWPAFAYANGAELLAIPKLGSVTQGERVKILSLWQANEDGVELTLSQELVDSTGEVVFTTQRNITANYTADVLNMSFDLPADIQPGTYTIRLIVTERDSNVPLDAATIPDGIPFGTAMPIGQLVVKSPTVPTPTATPATPDDSD